MKKMILCLLAILPVFFMSCSSDGNDENGGMSTKQALDKIKKEINGKWRMFAQWDNLYTNYWSLEDEYGIMKKHSLYELTFNYDGTVTDKDGKKHSYTIEYNDTDNHGSSYPLKKGHAKLTMTGFEEYYNEFYIYINEDNELRLYDSWTGAPKFIFIKN